MTDLNVTDWSEERPIPYRTPWFPTPFAMRRPISRIGPAICTGFRRIALSNGGYSTMAANCWKYFGWRVS